VFNCGIGLVTAVDPGDAARAAKMLAGAGETVYEIGRIERGSGGEAEAVVV
jgi:phosphoribosylaminoimidazole (AIR) synthetase